MRISCPHCGERSLDEFAYHGDANATRPLHGSDTPVPDFAEYVYQRTNPAGDHRELWYHSAGCHAWLVVTRNVMNHDIKSVELARAVTLQNLQAAKAGAS